MRKTKGTALGWVLRPILEFFITCAMSYQVVLRFNLCVKPPPDRADSQCLYSAFTVNLMTHIIFEGNSVAAVTGIVQQNVLAVERRFCGKQ